MPEIVWCCYAGSGWGDLSVERRLFLLMSDLVLSVSVLFVEVEGVLDAYHVCWGCHLFVHFGIVTVSLQL
jgi:hypothetical protein